MLSSELLSSGSTPQGLDMVKELLKSPSMVIYWADSKLPLSHTERSELEQVYVQVVNFGPLEILLEHPESGRHIVVRGITDPNAPNVPGHVLGRA